MKLRVIPFACAVLFSALAQASPAYHFRVFSIGVKSSAAPDTGAEPAPVVPADLVFLADSGGVLTGLAFPDTSLGSDSAALAVTLKNSGGADLVFGSTPVQAPVPFHIGTSTCSGTLVPQATCKVEIFFSPTAAQDYSGAPYALTINSSVTGKSVPLSGKGTAAGIAQVVPGPGFTFIQKTDGTWAGVGTNTSGQLGIGTASNVTRFTPIPGLSGAVQVLPSQGPSTFAKFADGSWWATGGNTAGQLGIGTTTNQLSFVPVPDLAGAQAVVPGGQHTYAKTSSGVWAATGSNTYGQLGLGDSTDRSRFTSVPTLQGATAVVSGYYHAFARRADGTWASAGYNGWGQLGDGGTASRSTFTANSGLTGVTTVVASGSDTFTRASNGTWKGAGDNRFGQLGIGSTSTTGVTSFTSVSFLTGATEVIPGVWTFAHLADGTWAATGSNSYGQLGLGDAVDRSSFVRVTAIAGADKVFVTGSSTFVRMSDGTWRAAGYNAGGQLGTGDTANTSTFKTMVP